MNDTTNRRRRKRLVLDQAKLSRAQKILGAESESETVERALDFVIGEEARDRKSTRLNSSHANISYAVFCLKKKKSPRNPPGTIRLPYTSYCLSVPLLSPTPNTDSLLCSSYPYIPHYYHRRCFSGPTFIAST